MTLTLLASGDPAIGYRQYACFISFIFSNSLARRPRPVQMIPLYPVLFDKICLREGGLIRGVLCQPYRLVQSVNFA
jgi:hypothetical protein